MTFDGRRVKLPVAVVAEPERPWTQALPQAQADFAVAATPADRAKALQDAFMAMTKDPDYIAGAQKLSIDTSPIDGEAVRQLLVQSAATPKDVIARYNQITGVTQ